MFSFNDLQPIINFRQWKIDKNQMFKCRLFVIQKLAITFMIGFYVHKSFSLYIGYLKTFHINNKTIPLFVNLSSKQSTLNISYTSIVNIIYEYLDVLINTSYVIYNITKEKQTKQKTKIRKIN